MTTHQLRLWKRPARLWENRLLVTTLSGDQLVQTQYGDGTGHRPFFKVVGLEEHTGGSARVPLEAVTFQDSSVLGNFFVGPLPTHTAYPRGHRHYVGAGMHAGEPLDRSPVLLPVGSALVSLTKLTYTSSDLLETAQVRGLQLFRSPLLDSSSSRPRKPHGKCLQLQQSRLLGGLEIMIQATKLGNFIKRLVPYMARHSGPSINAALGARTRKEVKDVGWWKSDCSVRATGAASQILPPSSYQAFALRCESVLHEVISGSSEPPVRPRSISMFLPR